MLSLYEKMIKRKRKREREKKFLENISIFKNVQEATSSTDLETFKPENMLRLVRVQMPQLISKKLISVIPMEDTSIDEVIDMLNRYRFIYNDSYISEKKENSSSRKKIDLD